MATHPSACRTAPVGLTTIPMSCATTTRSTWIAPLSASTAISAISYDRTVFLEVNRPDAQLHALVPPLCVAEPLTGTVRPRNFAVILFGRQPQKFIPGAFSLFSIYPGIDRSEPHGARQEVGGTLLDQAKRLASLLEAEQSPRKTERSVRKPEQSRRKAEH
jgi:hypothetical protein